MAMGEEEVMLVVGLVPLGNDVGGRTGGERVWVVRMVLLAEVESWAVLSPPEMEVPV